MIKQLRVVLQILFLLVTFLTNAQLYTFKNFNHRDGLTLSAILSIEESDDGYLWFGTDGAGLMKFDGQNFDYLEEVQGRTNRHVNHIDVVGDKVLYTTLYRKNYKLQYNQLEKLDYFPQYGSNRALINFADKEVLIQDGGIFIFEDSLLLTERKTFPFNEATDYYGAFEKDRRLFIFTSKGNYVLSEEVRVENLYDWLLGTSQNVTDELVGVAKTGDSLVFVSSKLDKEIVVLMDDIRPKFFIEVDLDNDLLNEDETIIASDSRFDFTVFVSNQGRVFLRDHNDGSYFNLYNNSEQPIVAPSDVLIDRNHDVWVTSLKSGVFRISLEPFTQINFNEVYRDPLIMFIHRTEDFDAVISTGKGKTFVGNRYTNKSFVEYDLRVYSMTSFKDKNYAATNKGLKIVQNTNIQTTNDFNVPQQSISLVFGDDDNFWYGLEGKGIYRYNLPSDSTIHYSSAPAYFYTAVYNSDSSSIYFGSNNGVFHFDCHSNELNKLPSEINGTNLGSYVGNSTRDRFGTCWLSVDEGIYGITASGDYTAITAERFLPSTLIYTLNSDDNGNIIVGTNKGVTVIKVDKEGNALNSNTYNVDNGFNGYETHMRSSFKTNEGLIFVGTLEGLFMIRPDFLNKSIRPILPSITEINNIDKSWFKLKEDRNIFDVDNSSFSFEFKSVNAKTTFVKFSHRLLGSED